MVTRSDPRSDDANAPSRSPLTRERVLRAALELADREGLEALSMRRLGRALGVEAMSLYNHVADKEAILDGITDLVAAEFEVPAGPDWKAALRRSSISAHEVLLRHPWASSLLESRTNLGPARLRWADSVIGMLARAGFPLPVVARAFMALDSHTYGFTLQEQAWPFDPDEAATSAATMASQLPGDEYPHLVAMAELAARPGGIAVDFEFGLDLLLDGLERLLESR